MQHFIEEIGEIVIEAFPTITIIGVISYLVFGGPLKEMLEMYCMSLYG